MTTPNGDNVEYAAFNFCSMVDQNYVAADKLGCDDVFDTNTYATLVNIGQEFTCLPAATNSYKSVTESELLLPDGDTTTFALQYSNDATGCSLLVGLVCDDDIEEYKTSSLKLISGCKYETVLMS